MEELIMNLIIIVKSFRISTKKKQKIQKKNKTKKIHQKMIQKVLPKIIRKVNFMTEWMM